MTKKIDTLLKRADFFEKLSICGDRKTLLEALAQDVIPLGDLDQFGNKKQPTGIPPVPPEPAKQSIKPTIAPAPKWTPKYSPIDATLQAALNTANEQAGGIAASIREDGSLGPETLTALDAFKQHYNLQDVDNKYVWEIVKQKAAEAPVPIE
jgi:hypothetical protein